MALIFTKAAVGKHIHNHQMIIWLYPLLAAGKTINFTKQKEKIWNR